jgi:NADH:ubiquinone reductase (non-electrogenic)
VQVAERQGKYIAKTLNSMDPAKGRASKAIEKAAPSDEPFVYKHLGSMATIGRYKALVDLRENKVRASTAHDKILTVGNTHGHGLS